MTEVVYCKGIRSVSAPYLPHPELLLKNDTFPNILFFKSTSHCSEGLGIDVFSAGEFEEANVAWNGSGNSCLKHARLGLESTIDAQSGLLAGYLAYEYGFSSEEKWANLRLPREGYAWRLLKLPYWYEADHQQQRGRVCYVDGTDFEQLQKVIKAPQLHEPLMYSPAIYDQTRVGDIAELTQDQYCAGIEAILKDIVAGRYYELNFTQRFSCKSNVSPAEAFQKIIERHRPKHAFYGKFSDEVIGSCSPELFFRRSGNSISTRPIKGSFSKETNSEELEKLGAEHVMVVDLARNDFGRISDLAPVVVTEFMAEREYGGLHHFESTVSGKTSLAASKLLPHLLPAASITGAPKVEVVKAISEYEVSARGVYTGTCGGFWPDGNIDLNVAIRTFRATPLGSHWNFQMGAGGAIVADSKPEDEYMECLRKAWPLVPALKPSE